MLCKEAAVAAQRDDRFICILVVIKATLVLTFIAFYGQIKEPPFN